jgi:hypothetical protein
MKQNDRNDTDIAHIFDGRTWAQHNKLRGPSGKDVRTRPCMCINEECKEQWLECWGSVNAPHLRRVGDVKETAKCGMTPEHAGAQSIVAGLLGLGKELVFKRECITCGDVCVNKVRMSSEEECRPEAFFHTERRNFADLGILPKGAKRGTRPTKIIEILQSSATSEEHRPQDIPWFEIKAQDVNEHTALQPTDPLHELEFKCQRKIECEQCMKIGPFVDWIRAQDKGTPRDMWNRQYYSKCIMCESLCEHEPLHAPPGQYDIRNPYSRGPDYLYALHRLCWTHSLYRMGACDSTTACEFFAGATMLYAKRREQFEEAKRVAAEVERVAAEVERVAAETKRIAAVEATRAERAKVFRQSVVAKMYARREQKSKRKLHRLDKSVNMKRICTKLICSSAAIPCVVSAPQTVLYSALLQLGKVRPEQHVSGFYR